MPPGVKKKSKKSTSKGTQPLITAFITVGAVLLVLTIAFTINHHKRIWRLFASRPIISNHFIPEGFEVHGIDISRYQGKINWQQLASGKLGEYSVQFVFMKSTEGADLRDPHFIQYWKASSEAGFIRGAYHYFKPKTDPEQQARFFIKNTPLEEGDLPPVLDFEEDGRLPETELRKNLLKWLDLVERHYGVKPILYCNAGFYKKYISGKIDGYTVWIAHYKSPKPGIQEEDWHFWQYTEEGNIDGIKGPVDLNVFKGTSEELQELLIWR
jgi:lysozyme